MVNKKFLNILNILRKIIIFKYINIAVYGSGLSAKSHNLRNAGSNPAAATKFGNDIRSL